MNIAKKTDSEIDQLYEAWGQAFQRKNPEAILDLLTPDYVLWPAGAPAMNRDSLASRLTAAFSAYDITPFFEREERLVSGDFAFERGWDIQQVRSRTGSNVKIQRQRVFLVLQRGADANGDSLGACPNRDQLPNMAKLTAVLSRMSSALTRITSDYLIGCACLTCRTRLRPGKKRRNGSLKQGRPLGQFMSCLVRPN